MAIVYPEDINMEFVKLQIRILKSRFGSLKRAEQEHKRLYKKTGEPMWRYLVFPNPQCKKKHYTSNAKIALSWAKTGDYPIGSRRSKAFK